MGRIKTKDIKKIAAELAKRPEFSTDFEKNKTLLKELDITDEKTTRNKIAGCIVRIKKKETIQ